MWLDLTRRFSQGNRLRADGKGYGDNIVPVLEAIAARGRIISGRGHGADSLAKSGLDRDLIG